jgi:ABC-2 type transport system permease protein
MNKTSLVFKREFLTRVKKKSFLIMTIVGPLLLGSLVLAPLILATIPEGPKTIVVVDEAALILGEKGNDKYQFAYLPAKDFDLEKAKDFFKQSGHDALLYIRRGETGDPHWVKDHSAIYGKSDISLSLQGYIEDLMETRINQQLLLREGISPEVVAQSRVNVSLATFSIDEEGEKASATSTKMIAGYLCGVLIYFFVFFYTSQVMRGVIEEKTNRIVEVIISSVRPFQLMMGKILGVGAVGLVQFLIWVVLSSAIYAVGIGVIFKDKLTPETVMSQEGMQEAVAASEGMQFVESMDAINFPVVIGGFLFFFIGGYLLYAALFAAIGSAVDNETDTQQFMLPVTIPLILGIVVTSKVIEDPNGALAFWFSIVPLTSPIVMMTRLPFGVPTWELGLSMVLLVLGFIAATWLAARIYRVGILMYGKKPTWKEMFKWMTYKNG